MKFYFHSLTDLLPFHLNQFRLSSPELNPVLGNYLKWTLLQLKSLNFWQLLPWNFPLYSLGVEPTENTVFYCPVLSSAYVLIRFLAKYNILLRMLNPAVMCLLSLCLAVVPCFKLFSWTAEGYSCVQEISFFCEPQKFAYNWSVSCVSSVQFTCPQNISLY
jgi:hypothetical protein